MSERNFMELLRAQWGQGKFLCVGLDSDFRKLPKHIGGILMNSPWWFNEAIVKATAEVAGAYKLNSAFYEAYGPACLEGLHLSIGSIREHAPHVPMILDVKRGDIGATSTAYAQAAFDFYRADAVTVNPYLGQDALQPFLDRKDKGIIVLCRTSNKGAGEFQGQKVIVEREELLSLIGTSSLDDLYNRFGWSFASVTTNSPCYAVPFYQYVALRVARHWNANGNCALVAGATHPTELAQIRRLVPDMPLLIPGIGKQGGDVEATVKAGMDSRGAGMLINASSSVIYASDGPDFAEAAGREALRLHNLINEYRKKGGAVC